MQPRSLRQLFRVGSFSLILFALFTVSAIVAGQCATPVKAASEAEVETIFGHFSPFADSIYRSRVNVSISGESVGTELPYLSQVTDLTFLTGTHEIAVEPLEWPGYVFTKTVTIPDPDASGLTDPVTLVALIGGAGALPMDVFVQHVEQAAPAADVQVRLTHLSPYSVGGDTEYTICNSDGTVYNGISMIPYGQSSDYVSVSSGQYSIYLSGSYAGCAERLTPNLYLLLEEASVADLYAVGSNEKPMLPNSVTIISASAKILYPQSFLPQLYNSTTR